MKLQRWTVYKKVGSIKANIGTVVTNMEGTQEQAWYKAAQKYVGKPYTIGWSLHVKKDVIEDMQQ
jgi:hypothetical protein